nr:hypothetical protein CFP56_15587 [Quercus suber]
MLGRHEIMLGQHISETHGPRSNRSNHKPEPTTTRTTIIKQRKEEQKAKEYINWRYITEGTLFIYFR